jgi:TP901 family phage tail tape measure protein
MADEMVYGIRITGDAGGAQGAVNQALTALKQLDSRLKAMANRAVGSLNTPINKMDQIGGSQDTAAWSRRQELELARQRMMAAQQHLDALKKKDTGTKAYATRIKKAEQEVYDTSVAFARKLTQVVIQEKKAQEQAAKRTADAQIREAKRVNAEMTRAAKSVGQGAMWGINSFISSLGSAGNSFRLLTQGFSEIGRVLTTFISIPLGAFFAASLKTAIDFEAAIVRVGKTTGLEGAKLQDLTQWIREFAKYTVSSHVELATFAEQLGQLGVVDKNAMQRLVATVEMMASATDLSADEVTKSLGRIATAFGYDLNSEGGVRAIEQLSNTINKLENTTAASAGEIIEGLLNVASVGGMLDIPVKDMAAVVAMMESMGVAADAVGNRLTRFYGQLITKADDAAKFMKGFTTTVKEGNEYITRTYSGDKAQLLEFINKDRVQVLQDFMGALDQVPDAAKAEAMAQWFDLVGQVGGKVGVLAGNTKGLADALKTAREEFERGNSLFEEYDKALLTTESHMKILRNNINDAAITVGDAFLPVLNRLVEYAIPGIQMLAAAFKSLSWETKVLVVAVPLIATVLAPLIFIVAQLAHGFGMLFMGFQTFGVLAKNVGMSIFGVGKALFSLFNFFKLAAAGGSVAVGVLGGGLAPALLTVAAAIAGVVAGGALLVAALRSLQSRGVDVAGFFMGLAERARSWGEGLMATYADGLLSGAAQFVANAVAQIAEWIAGFFEAHSPPKEGPLANIDKWGGPLFTTYLRGFKNADFGILSEVGNTVKSILGKMMSGDGAEAAINGMVMNARVALSELISVFNKTGNITQGLMDKVVKGTGHLAGDVKTLITLWLQYEKTQRRLKELEQDRQNAQKGYEDEVARIAASNLTAEEKAERIRNAIAKRNRTFNAIDAETEAEKEKGEALKEQLEWQKEFIKAQLDQADLFDKIAKAIDKMGGALSDAAGLLSKAAGGLGSKGAVNPLEGLETTIQERIDGAREVIKGFLRGLKGQLLDTEFIKLLPPETQEELQKAYDLGMKVYKIFHPDKKESGGGGFMEDSPILAALKGFGEGAGKAIEETIQNVTTLLNSPEMKKAGETLGKLMEALFGKKTEGELTTVEGKFERIGYWVTLILGSLAVLLALVANAFAILVNVIDGVLTGWYILKQVDDFLESLQNKLTQLGQGVLAIVVGGIVGGNEDWVSDLLEYLTEQFNFISERAAEWGENLIKTYGEGFLSGAGKWLSDAVSDAAQAIADFFEPHSPPKTGPLSTIDTWGSKLLKLLIDGFVGGDFNPLGTIGQMIIDAIGNIDFGGVFGTKKEGDGILGSILTFFGDIGTSISEKWTEIKNAPTTVFAGWWEVVLLPIFTALWTGIAVWFATYTPMMLQNWVLFRDTFKVGFEPIFGMVAAVFAGLFFNPQVVEALKIAYDMFFAKGGDFAAAVGNGIKSVTGNVSDAVGGLVDTMVSKIGTAISAIEDLIAAYGRLNDAASGAIIPGGGGGRSGSVPGGGEDNNPATPFAKGGIATRPTFAWIAEAGEDEAVIPLSKLPGLMSEAMPVPESTTVNVNIINPQVRSDNDVRTLVREVRRDMNSTLRDQKRLRGRS